MKHGDKKASELKGFSGLKGEVSVYLEGLKKRLGREEKDKSCPRCQGKMVMLGGKVFCGEFCFEEEKEAKKKKDKRRMKLTMFDEKMQQLFLSKGRKVPSIEMVKIWWEVVCEEQEESLRGGFKTYMMSLRSDLQVSVLLDFARNSR